MRSLRSMLGRHTDLFLIVAMIGILVVLFSPIPSRLLDFLLITNVSFALLLLLLTFYVDKPVRFSTFPSLLLIATLFRLSLNVAATRLILSSGEAGKVIAAVGEHVVGGNYVIGLIVFLILVVVQYVVVTSGAQRVAEVAARFTLDSMPGQQMSIDADLNMGFIDQAEAQQRRKEIEKEANFYGSMDGASKFVKGDAIAGIIILLIDILGGLAIGVMQMGMPWSEALHTFTLLTIGDGIVTQVPALVIAVGTGIIVTRSGTDAQLGSEIVTQFSAFPKTLLMVMAALFGVALLPGMPVVPVVILWSLLGGMVWLIWQSKKLEPSAAADGSVPQTEEPEGIFGLLAVDPVEVRVGAGLVGLIHSGDHLLMERIAAFRRQFALELGLILPKVCFRDSKRLNAQTYQISIFGVRIGEAELITDRVLAISPGAERGKIAGIETRDPTYGLPAVWIEDAHRQAARASGYTVVDPVTVFVTHLTELLRRQAADLLTRAMTDELVDRVRKTNGGLVDELVPAILSLSEIQKILQNLLREKVTIRNLEAILEVLADAGRGNRDAEYLTEVVRQKLGSVICHGLAGDHGELQVLTFEPAIEHQIASSVRNADDRATLILEPGFAEQIIARLALLVERMVKHSLEPVLLCAPELRRHIRRVTERVLPHLAVVSMAEIPNTINLKSYGVVKL